MRQIKSHNLTSLRRHSDLSRPTCGKENAETACLQINPQNNRDHIRIQIPVINDSAAIVNR